MNQTKLNVMYFVVFKCHLTLRPKLSSFLTSNLGQYEFMSITSTSRVKPLWLRWSPSGSVLCSYKVATALCSIICSIFTREHCWQFCNHIFSLLSDSLKIFVPMTVLALLILIPVNVSSGTLSFLKKELVTSDIDKLSISNVRPESVR